MEQVIDRITVAELSKMAMSMYGDFVKAVVDLQRKVLVVDAEMHADEELYLLEAGSTQTDLWGINLYPEKFGEEDFVEFDSMINIRPRQQNRSRGVEDENLRRQIIALVASMVEA
ncbi:MAG: DUF5674 family protein [Candidatus Dormibacteraceae bacterium]